MSRPRPLFVMGNKRSGSTLTVNLLNSHANVFVSHEADIAWILYQARNGMPDRFEVHPLDSAMMMTSTVKRSRRLLEARLKHGQSREDIAKAFFEVQSRLMSDWLRYRTSLRGRFWLKAREIGRRPSWQKFKRGIRIEPDRIEKGEIAWIGDKKHAQHLDPKIRAFLTENFPDARYVHVVRNPVGVIASMVEAKKSWYVMPDYFKEPAMRVLEQWAVHEEWVLEAKERDGSEILTVRLEDLCSRPEPTVEMMLGFLDLPLTDAVRERIPRLVDMRDPNAKYANFPLPEMPRARRIMELYGYV